MAHLQIFDNGPSSFSSVSETAQAVRTYINQNDTENYDCILSGDPRWDIFYHLSEMRQSILNWYEFKNDSDTLEIGGEFGALTGLLLSRCKHVTVVEGSPFRAEAILERYRTRKNLTVRPDIPEPTSGGTGFDYIILIGALEYVPRNECTDYLKRLKKLLNPGGALLLAVDNRFGIRYFCGAEEMHTGIPFDGINRYPCGSYGSSFDRQELISILREAGLDSFKFYYPLPDYRLPQVIYSEEGLPESGVGERIVPYYFNRDSLLAYENDLFDDLARNHVFEFFSNSFFVECVLDRPFCNVTYAAVTTERGPKHAFITSIHSDGRVKKRPAYQGELEGLRTLSENMKDLQKHGISVVPHSERPGELEMPFIDAPLLSTHMRDLARDRPQEFEAVFDRLYKAILDSSALAQPQDNALLTDENAILPWGPILKKAYIELIPLNSFFCEGSIVYFDQEFVKENYPAKYTLYRALRNTYLFNPFAESAVPLEFMKKKYGLAELWDILEEEDNQFLSSIRNYDTYGHFYEMTQVDRTTFRKNAGLLSGRRDKNGFYTIPLKMRQVMEVQVDLIRQFQEICDRHHLRFFMFYGTLLGAVRHRGFIPWDDDADFVMPREDYDAFLEIAPKELNSPYLLQTPYDVSDCYWGHVSRLCNTGTTALPEIDWGSETVNGIWIDIFSLDTAASQADQKERQVRKVRSLQKLAYTKLYPGICLYPKFRWKLARLFTRFMSFNALLKKIDKNIQLCREPSEYYGVLNQFSLYQGQRLYRTDFDSAVYLDFESLKLPAPAGYKRCLEITMGKNYMEFPPEAERKPHHACLFFPALPYRDFFRRYVRIMDDASGKTIVLFGSGMMMEDYMKRLGATYSPAFVVDNDSKKWGRQKLGIEIKSPEELLRISSENLKLIICNTYYRQIEKQLSQMGINGYCIYIQEVHWIYEDEEKELYG